MYSSGLDGAQRQMLHVACVQNEDTVGTRVSALLEASFEPLIPSFTTRVSLSGPDNRSPTQLSPSGSQRGQAKAVKSWGLVYRGLWRGSLVSRSQQDAGRMWINPLIQRTMLGVYLNTMGGMLAKGSGRQPSGLILSPACPPRLIIPGLES